MFVKLKQGIASAKAKAASAMAWMGLAMVAPGAALAVVPSPPTPSTAPGSNDAIAWLEGLFEDGGEVAILAIGIGLFVIGAIGMIWAISELMGGRKGVGEVAKIGLASAVGIAFGTYALTQASAII